MRKDERGMMVVEALISFIAFILVCIGIVFMIKVFMLHNRVQYAINSAARELAAYSYVYDAFGLRDGELKVNADGKESTGKVETITDNVIDTVVSVQDTMSQLKSVGNSTKNLANGNLSTGNIEDALHQTEGLVDSMGNTVDAGKNTINSIKETNPKELLKGIIYIGMETGADAARSWVAEVAVKGLAEKYLMTSKADADAYLRAYGVDGYDALDFSVSSMFSDDDFRVIDIVVEYDIDLSFLNYILPNRKIHAVQRVSVAGWVGGDNQKVTKEGRLIR